MTEPAVLLVDDRRENLVALEAVLEPLGLDLVSVTSGEEALRELLRREFAAILLDVQMPGMDGFATAELVKRRPRTQHVPIVFITAISKDEEHVYRGYASGAVDYIFKPFNDAVLRSKVAALVDLHRRQERLREQEDSLRERELDEIRRAEEQRYRDLAEAMPQIVWVSDPDGRATYYNRQWFDYTGLDPSRASEADWRDVVHPNDLQRALEVRKATLASGDVFDVEYRFRSANGGYRWHLGRAVPVRTADGAVDHWVGTATDIHDQKRSEEIQQFLLEASSLLGSLDYSLTLADLARLVVKHVADWCIVELVEEDGRLRQLEVAHADPSKVAFAREMRERYPARDATGSARVVATGKPELIPEVTEEMIESAAVDELHLELLRTLGLRSYLCVPMIARDRVLGSIAMVQTDSSSAFGQPELELAVDLARRAAVAIDNAQLYRQTEEQAQAARVLAAIGDGVALIDEAGVVRFWNPAAEQITGRAETEVLGRRLIDAFPGWNEGAAGPAELVPLELGEREIWLSISRVRFDDGTVYAFRDLTEERALESIRQDLVATVSHELRTPLAAIYGSAVTLRRGDIEIENELRDRLLDIVVDEAERLAEIVNDLLLASQLDAGTLTTAIEATDPLALAESVIQSARAHLPEGTEVVLEASSTVPRVAADPGQLRQVLTNLVDNAVKYSPEGGEIHVRLDHRGDQLRLAVADRGIGIPAAEQRRIFEKFYRVDPDMTQGVGGTGLGLYISRELVRRVGGRIWVESREGQGSTFFIEIPLAQPKGAKKKQSAAAA